MLNPEIIKMLKKVENDFNTGVFTSAKLVDSGTFVCFVEELSQGKAYHQFLFEELPKQFRDAFKGQKTGAKIGSHKIMAIFDV